MPPVEATLKTFYRIAFPILILAIVMTSCSTPVVDESPPEERIRQARIDMEKKRNERAYESLEGLRLVTAGTRLGGEVQFLLGEAAYNLGKFPEAESHYEAYLNAYPAGPFTEKAVYRQAISKVKQIQKRKIGLLSFKAYIPHDRDISLLREARVLFQLYVERYPDGEWVADANRRAEELLTKEGMHELEIASFYLRKNNPLAAIKRAGRILGGEFPEKIKDDARGLIRDAEESIPQEESVQDL